MFWNNITSQDIQINWKLAWKPNILYHKIINNDIVKSAYSDKKQATNFALNKRLAYKNVLANPDYIGWQFTDCTSVMRWKCEDEWRDIYRYAIDPSWESAQIFKSYRWIDWEENCISVPLFDTPICRCKCQANNFIKLLWPTWARRLLSNSQLYSSTGVQKNVPTSIWSFQWRFYDDSFSTRNFWTAVQTWDYIYAYCSSNSDWSWFAWQIRKIVWFDWSTNEILTDVAWTLDANQLEWDEITYSIFSDWWEIIVYPICSWLMSLHPDGSWYTILPVCNAETNPDNCIWSLQEHDWSIHYLDDKWWNRYWWIWYDIFYFSDNQIVSTPATTIWTVSFRDHLVYFWYDFIWAIFRSTFYNNADYQSLKLSDNFWIRSRYSYLVDDNSFLMVTSWKRLKSISVIQSWWEPQIKIDDVTDFFNGDLDKLNKWDEVYMSKVWSEIRIHIVWRELDDWDKITWRRTKMLILDTEYWLYHIHTVCCAEITRYCWWKYLWWWIYDRCWYQDCWYPNEYWITTWMSRYDQIIACFIWDNQNNNLWFDLFNPKKISYTKTMLWPSILTNDNTSLTYTQYRNWYKSKYILNEFENIKWVSDWNKVFAWEVIEPDECIIDDLLDCQNIDNECKYWMLDTRWPDRCNCEWEIMPQDDYCVCYNNKWYFLSNVYPVESKRESKRCDLIEIEWRSSMWDRMNFNGFVSRVSIGQITDDIYDDNTLENEDCCVKKCNNSSCL